MAFDASAAKRFPAGKALAIAGCPGLRLHAMKNFKTWVYRYKTPAGKLKQVAIGPWPADRASAWLESTATAGSISAGGARRFQAAMAFAAVYSIVPDPKHPP